jgi:hypothetical protein
MSPDALPGLAMRLVPWLRSWRAGLTSVDEVVTAMTTDGMSGVEQVMLSHGEDGPGRVLAAGLPRLSSTAPDAIRLVLAVPGDARGLPTTGPFTAAALDSGEAVTAGDIGVVPQRQSHTSGSGDTWQTITWRVFALPQAVVEADPTTVGEADLALSEAMREATTTLTGLDVARWDPALGRALAQMRPPQGWQLPPGFDGRSRRLYARAAMLTDIVRVAESDALGGAVTAFEASARMSALRPLSAACRQAVRAACHAPLRC